MACRATSQPSDTTVYLHRSPKLASCNSRCLIPCSRHEVVTTPLRRRQTAHRVHRMRESTCGYRKVDTTADRDAFKRKVDMKTRAFGFEDSPQPACDSSSASGRRHLRVPTSAAAPHSNTRVQRTG